MMPTVNAIIAPMTMAFDAISVDLITAEIMEIDAVAAIIATGAIAHGISRVNHARVCIFTPPFFISHAERCCQIIPMIDRLSHQALLPNPEPGRQPDRLA
jgi:hypothetical protein